MQLPPSFFARDVLEVAPDLLGKTLVRRLPNGQLLRLTITETEAYRGEDDLACHAAKGRTARTEVMYHKGGKVYVYLIYGMYWMLNVVVGEEGHPQAVLIRACESINGPGRLGKALQLDKSFYGEDLSTSQRLWIEHGIDPKNFTVVQSPRIGVHYAGEHWANIHWRYNLVAKGKVTKEKSARRKK
jgi:DNA-3-methyladenine glycosylase